jgi:hypothetical protein
MDTKRFIRILKGLALVAVVIGMVNASKLTAQAAVELMPNGDLFDPEYYAWQNPDVVAVVGNDIDKLYYHYKTYGETEGRQPYDAQDYSWLYVYTNTVPWFANNEFKYSREKYTAEEAMAVYRSILEENGMIWDPSIKEFSSWGTGFMEYYKGYPEESAQRALEGFAYGDGVGDSDTRFYFEVTSTSKFYIYFTEWSC